MTGSFTALSVVVPCVHTAHLHRQVAEGAMLVGVVQVVHHQQLAGAPEAPHGSAGIVEGSNTPITGDDDSTTAPCA